MDWSAVAAIATTIAAFGAVVSVLVALWLSPPMQKYLHRHDTFKQLQPYERDILKAILCSRLGLGCILIRKGSIDPVIEVALSDYGNLSEGRVLIVGQSFYQLSLESLESLGLLRAVKVIRHPPLPLPKGQTPPEHRAYRITGKGTQFIQKYENDLREKSYKGCYIDLTSSNSVVTRYKAWILRGSPETLTIPTTEPAAWVVERQKEGCPSTAIIAGHNLGIEEGHTVHIICDLDPSVGQDEYHPYAASDISRRAKVLSIEERDAVYDDRIRVEGDTLAKVRFID